MRDSVLFRRSLRALSVFLIALAPAVLTACGNNTRGDSAVQPAPTAAAPSTRPSTTRAAATAPAADRWEAEIRKIEATQTTRPAPADAVVFVGSSSIRGWRTLEKDFAGTPVINAGFGGSRIPDAVRYADRLVLAYKPKAVVFYSGENDLTGGRTPEQALADFQAFVAKVHAKQPKTPIVFISMKPSVARWRHADKFRQGNELIRQYTEADARLSYLDVWPAMLGPDGQPRPELFVGDKLHMNEQGYAIWTDLVGKHLTERGIIGEGKAEK